MRTLLTALRSSQLRLMCDHWALCGDKAVGFVPYVNGMLNLVELSVTDEHWSVRKQGAAVQE